jgi:hypothetical protein
MTLGPGRISRSGATALVVQAFELIMVLIQRLAAVCKFSRGQVTAAFAP